MNYAKQSNKPEWYDNDPEQLYYCATSGSNPENEWYEFNDRKEALNFIQTTFHSQSYINHCDFAQGEIYNRLELYEALVEQFGEDHDYDEVIYDADLSGVEPMDLAEVIQYESVF